jgi:hypothetical protein
VELDAGTELYAAEWGMLVGGRCTAPAIGRAGAPPAASDPVSENVSSGRVAR